MTKNILQQRYYTSDVDGGTFIDFYGVILLINIRLHVSHLNLINFPQSFMGRRLILTEIKFDKTETIRIGTIHLESLNTREERQRQLNIC